MVKKVFCRAIRWMLLGELQRDAPRLLDGLSAG
jgi:hypothetical protein